MKAAMKTPALFIILLAGVLGQYSVHQDLYIFVTEGAAVQIICNYTGTEYSLQWYQRVSGHKIQPLLILRTNGYESLKRFTSFLDTKKKFTFLYINQTRMEDSAVYYCALEAL
ncbi:hypothetical protein GDO81_001854 [Engystomops pustulosus]|uniref:Ig-like domain-containing protein n=1 Tax=Engystomops pustulosus TaxID=76066 RepID=A0AAV7DGM3_ENGPU|nr:hypothetical protein GDO81_001854 [Engystomops pustulosus]